MRNEKEAFVRLEGAVFGDVPVRIELSIQVPDAFNSAGVIVDAIRVAKWALSRGNGGVIHEAAAAFCKRPPPRRRRINLHIRPLTRFYPLILRPRL